MTAETFKERIERKKREAQAKIDAAKRKNPERFSSTVVFPGTTVTVNDLEKSSDGREVYGQGDKN